MGHNIRFRRLRDAARYEGDIAITCRQCRYEVVIDLDTLLAILAERRINDELHVVCRALRCHRCGRRWPHIAMTQRGDRRTLRLNDGDPLGPSNIPLSVWLSAHRSDRKRLRRMARG